MARAAKWMFIVFGLSLLTIFLPRSVPVKAATLRVGPVPGPGVFPTIQQAVNNARPGDTILISGGTYPENINLSNMGSEVGASAGDLSLNALAGSGPVTLTSYGDKLYSSSRFPGSLVVDGLRFEPINGTAISLVTGFENVLIANVNIRALGTSVIGIYAVATSGSPTLAIVNSVIQEPPGGAIRVVAGASATPTIVLQNVTASYTMALGVYPANQAINIQAINSAAMWPTVRNSTVTGWTQGGIFIATFNEGRSTSFVAENTLSGQSWIWALSQASSPIGSETTILNNQLNGALRIGVEGSHQNSRIVGNEINANVPGGSINRGAIEEASSGNGLIANNRITAIQISGISLGASGNTTIANNTVSSDVTPAINISAARQIGAVDPKLAVTGNNVVGNIAISRSGDTVPQLEGNTSLTAAQNLSLNNTLNGTTPAITGPVGIIAPGTIIPLAVNTMPVASNDSVTTTPATATAIDILANDTDVDGPLTLRFVTPVSRQGGKAIANGTGVTFTSLPGFVGQDTFYYVVTDTDGAAAVAEVTVNIVEATVTPSPTLTVPSATATPTVTTTVTAIVVPTLTSTPVITATGAPPQPRQRTFIPLTQNRSN